MSEVNLACSSSDAGESVMGRNTCGVPERVNAGFGGSSFEGGPTIAVERVYLTISIPLLSYRLTLQDRVAPAFWLGELVVAYASIALVFAQLPLLETTSSHVLSQQHVEGGVDLLEGNIPNKHDGIKAFKDHANL